ncbi:hypothetical protein LTR70_004176 [Exophiala xenobiotica]|uniref:Uncharacterized protein n=1 Tax=Lithohypha guttulata TaxID=1690604 RepID=A0ABR0KE59_9EURO|nr:hypothetical protein LTR24_003658 [Lithohypha guttulata]KAK5321463.1 hypothetical protein LTR70_004176 [Exophiala xenobiotica]
MPPKKKGAVRPKAAKPAAKGRRSKLAKDNDLSIEDEREIREAWAIYRDDSVEGYEDEKEGVIPTSKVKMVMIALGIEPKSQKDMDEYIEILDPESEGYVTYTHFVELAAIQINNKSDETKDEEVEKAFKLFTSGGLLNQDVGDDVLKAMIVEANGGNNVGSGVDMEHFREVMSRAGIFT